MKTSMFSPLFLGLCFILMMFCAAALVGCASADQAAADVHNVATTVTTTAAAATTVINEASTIISAIMSNPLVNLALNAKDESPGNRAVIVATEGRRKDAEDCAVDLVKSGEFKTNEIRLCIGKDATDDYLNALGHWVAQTDKKYKSAVKTYVK